MDEHALRVLEYPKIKEILLNYTVSPLGKEAVLEMQPLTAIEEIRFAQMEVSEMVQLWSTNQDPPLDGVYDVREPIQRCGISGLVLEPAELIIIGETVRAARRIRTALKHIQVENSHLRRYGDQLILYPEFEEAMERVFDENKEIRDSASHELARIRKSIRSQRAHLVSRIEKLIRVGWKEYLQETLYTQREGRYVLPVDARYQSKVSGIIHDRSATGTTVYIEPLDLVEDGNYLKELHREEELEIRKILQQLTTQIADRQQDLLHNLEIFKHLEFLAAKARFSLKHQMNEPRMTDNGPIQIKNGRHPLLLIRSGAEGVTPLNLEFLSDMHGLVITGPNTGGKTVVLKTVGLLALMAQSGLHIPAASGSEMPVFQWIGADIGDEQSLEQNLSTFSSHIGNICSILQTAGPASLVLLDELGSGTDPVEGGALAVSILQQLHQQRTTFLVTTHLQDLKLFAHMTEGVENGAMEFDLQTLQPTFAFHLGLPGQSNAIQIADRLGIPAAVITRARAEMEQKGRSAEDLLTQLGEELHRARTLRRKAEEEWQTAQNLEQESEKRLANCRQEAQEVLRRAERKAQVLLQQLENRLQEMERQQKEFQKQWREKLTQLVQQSSQPQPPDTLLAHMRSELETVKRQMEENRPPILEEKSHREKWAWEDLKPGTRLRIAGFTHAGIVCSTTPNKQEVEISINSMTLRVKANRILAVLPTREKPAAAPPRPPVSVERPAMPEHKLEIIGQTVEEMTPNVLKFVDHAFLNGIPTVTIVHGYGTGTLRRAVRILLSDNPVVQSLQNGSEAEGGGAVTLVQLKSILS